MRGLMIFLGLLLMVGGGAVAGAQYAPIDLSTIDVLNQAFDRIPGSREFLKTPMALYTGGGAAGLGMLMIIIAAATGGKKTLKDRPVVKSPSMAPNPPYTAKALKHTKATPPKVDPAPPAAVAPPPISAAPMPPPMHPAAAPSVPKPAATTAPTPQPAPKPAPFQAAPAAPAAAAPAPPKPAPAPAPAPAPIAQAAPQLVAAAPAATAAPVAEAARKPQASAQPPAAAVGAPPPDPRVVNRKRVQDLVTINDALKVYRAKNGVFPTAAVMGGLNERGANWIPGLAPDFLKEVPRDPIHGATTQYVYVSDGSDYKLLAAGVSLVGSPNVEVLGIKVDPTRNPTAENAAFGFWTPDFAGA